MVEIKFKPGMGKQFWARFPTSFTLQNVNFEVAMVRVYGIEYDEATPELEDLFLKALVMQRLKE